MDYWRKAHKQLLAFSRYIVFYISKSYFYVFINVRGSQLFSNPVTFNDNLSKTITAHVHGNSYLDINRFAYF